MNNDQILKAVADDQDLAASCYSYLDEEEGLLAAAVPIMRAAQDSFNNRSFQELTKALGRHQEFAQLVGKMNQRRQRFSALLAAHLKIEPRKVTLALALARMPEKTRSTLKKRIEQVRKLADELSAVNYWLAVHLRIHLEAYRRILRDLTNSSAGSGRYGPAGKTESLDYGPMIHCRG